MDALLPRPSLKHARAGLGRAREEARASATRERLALEGQNAVGGNEEMSGAHTNPVYEEGGKLEPAHPFMHSTREAMPDLGPPLADHYPTVLSHA
ncbi:hypothetical protein ABBQ32_010841 [Trebouxia sp. C0010 RCD-2024]